MRYAEARGVAASGSVYLQAVEDVGHESFCDTQAFPPFEDVEEDQFGQLFGTSNTPVRFRDLSSGLVGGPSSVVAASGCCLVVSAPGGPVQQLGH
jgi:hypothetical protein